MKRTNRLLLLLFIASPIFAIAQDSIYFNNGNSILCKVITIDNTHVQYKQQIGKSTIDFSANVNLIKKIKYGDVQYNEGDKVTTEIEAPSEPKIQVYEKANLGAGIGLDYGGIGLNLTIYSSKYFGFFGGVGYALAGVGFNGGFKYRYNSDNEKSKINTYFMGMYGYNTAIYIANLPDHNKLFYGPSIGIGIEGKMSERKKTYLSVAISYPFRSSEVENYIYDLKRIHGVEFDGDLTPVTISIGIKHVLN